MDDRMSKLKPHPMTDRIPRRSDEQRRQLRTLLEREGQLVPIVVHGDYILDGRERYELLTEMGVKPKIESYKGDTSEAGVMMAVLSYSSGRCTAPSQRAMLAAELLPEFERIVADRKREVCRDAKLRGLGKSVERVPEPLGESRDLVGELLAVSGRSVSYAVEILRADKKIAARVKADPKFSLKSALTAVRHKTASKRVQKLRLAANVTIKDCDLRLGDNIEVMRGIEAASVRVIFADPPYNQGWKYRADPTGDRLPDDAYFTICRAWMQQAARLLAPDGSLFVLIDDTYTDHFGLLLRETGLYRQHTVIQFETFAQYNSAETSLSQNARYLHWYTKAEQPFINKVEARVQSKRQIIKDKRGNKIGRLPPNVWPFVRVTSWDDERCPWLGEDGEAPQLPRELPERCILLTSEPGDLILDPFNGNGITGIAALINDRKYIGIDRDKVGLEQARSWIAHEYNRLKETK